MGKLFWDIYIAHEGGYRAVVWNGQGETVHRSEPLPTAKEAKIAAAQFLLKNLEADAQPPAEANVEVQ